MDYIRDLRPAKWGSGALRSGNPKPLMSALSQKQTSEHIQSMSALPPKADIAEYDRHVRFVPKTDIAGCHERVESPLVTTGQPKVGCIGVFNPEYRRP